MADQTQYLTLGVENETFAVPVTAVREIIDVREIFRLPDAPPYVLGLIDVRERSVPVVDLRLKLGFPQAAKTENTRICVLEIDLGERSLVLGLIADRVFEVTGLDDSAIEPSPDIGVRWRSDYISGIGRRGEKLVIVFDLPRLFSAEETALLAPHLALTA
ncbi:chemotaxis protein CheW [Lacibacterium aquatile]|uniref:Chemotaxis protein CheW n=1 Tax=Lacibacterium aquatile TaxID=1168082 RepID=A0ABW5DMI9_9PROT